VAKVARSVVEKAGVDVDHLLDLLVRNASAELTTFYYYTILRVNLIGLEGEGSRRSPRRPASRTGTTLRRWCLASTSWAAGCRTT
jgi:ferritin-like protein